jgi:proline dehydrogenase
MTLLRSALIALSHNPSLRRFSESSRAGHRMSSRFVAGTTFKQVIEAARSLNQQGIIATLDSLGENVTTPQQARSASEVYHRLLDSIADSHVNSNVSLKLSQMGLEVSEELAYTLVASLVEKARSFNNFVRIDMEGSAMTETTLKLVRRLHSIPGNAGHVGVVLQSYLYRTEADARALVSEGIRIRLCKGAYKEPATVAFPEKSNVDANYLRVAQELISGPLYHGLATHDEQLIARIKDYVRAQQIPTDRFEFQMLYGVRRELQRALVSEGYRVRVYVPFGTEWYPYFMRRLAERPANLIFLAKNFFRS